MSKTEFELDNLTPKVDAGYSGNPLDPAKVTINKALGRYGAIPPFFIPRREDIITQVLDANEILEDYAAIGVIHSQMPMLLRRSGDPEFFLLPFEPLVTVSGKNTIIRRTVARSDKSGTIKERWSQDDFEVTIQGVMSAADESKYPERYIRKLMELFDERQAVEVAQDILQVFGIHHLAIESASFPHTKGLNNQNYEIKAYSDRPVSLLIPV
ncbi:DUF6046 domain-containing protein [Alistipes sp.]|uniref:DUF6046 domain-containing protein n=1 Tax=Alistipes sp. TaxID=1872444 RepID=UPI003AB8801C